MPTTKAQQKAVQKYVSTKYDRHVLTMPKGRKDKLKRYAVKRGESLNGFINRAIDESIDNDYCHKLYAEYQNSTDKGEPVEVGEFAKSLGISL